MNRDGVPTIGFKLNIYICEVTTEGNHAQDEILSIVSECQIYQADKKMIFVEIHVNSDHIINRQNITDIIVILIHVTI